MNQGIYKITNPKGAVYIGQSKNVNERLARYKKLQCCKNQHLLYRSFLKYGINNHTFEVLVIGEYSKDIIKGYFIKQSKFYVNYEGIGHRRY